MILPVEQGASLVLLSAMFANNLVLESQLALSPFLATSRRVDVAIAMAVMSFFLISLMSLLMFCLNHMVLRPLNLNYLSLLFTLFLFLVLMLGLQRYCQSCASIKLNRLAVFIPLLTLNSAVLSVILLTLESVNSVAMAIPFVLGVSLGFSIALVILAGISDRLEQVDIPQAFKGIPINLISLGILSIAFSGFE